MVLLNGRCGFLYSDGCCSVVQQYLSDFGAKQLAIIPCSLCQRPWIWEFHLKFLTFSFGFTSELNRLKFGSWNQGDRCGPPALLNIYIFLRLCRSGIADSVHGPPGRQSAAAPVPASALRRPHEPATDVGERPAALLRSDGSAV